MFKGPKGPSSGQTPRTIAEKMGTDPKAFPAGPEYDYAAGVPTGTGIKGAEQAYKQTAMKQGSDSAKPAGKGAPFGIKGG